jgi:hypothetical protein
VLNLYRSSTYFPKQAWYGGCEALTWEVPTRVPARAGGEKGKTEGASTHGLQRVKKSAVTALAAAVLSRGTERLRRCEEIVEKAKTTSRKGAKSPRSQTKQNSSYVRVFAPSREAVHFFTPSGALG